MINGYEYLKYHPETYRQFNCNDLTLVYYDCPQGIRKADIFTQCNVLVFVIGGTKIIHRPTKSWIMGEGSCHFFKKGAYIQELYYNEGWRSMALYIPDSYLKALIKEYFSYYKGNSQTYGQSELVMELDLNEIGLDFRRVLLASFSEDPVPPEALVEQRCRDLLFSILTNRKNEFFVGYLHMLAHEGKTSLTDIMEANYTFNLSVQEYAKIANRSLATFKRDFKNLFHNTPAKWLMDKRLIHAEVMLITTRMNINEITFESGFENISHFSRAFKERYGIAPLRYRKQYISSLS